MSDEIFLALGCGWRNYGEKWVHIDGGDYEHLDSKNITNLPYEDETVDIIYASHVLEYFDREEAIEVLKEWHSVLKPGGKIILSVPDYRKMAELYLHDDIPLHRFLGPLYGKMPMGKETIYHKTIYDYSSLGELLRVIGFKNLGLWDADGLKMFGDDYDDHSKAKVHEKSISLNMVASK